MTRLVLATLALNEMEWLPKLVEQHIAWRGVEVMQWCFVEAADAVYKSVAPEMVSPQGLSVDGTTEFLEQLAKDDPRVAHVRHGHCGSLSDRANGKAAARQRYLDLAERFRPDYLICLDADEMYTHDDQFRVVEHMLARPGDQAFSFAIRHPWRPPSLAGEPLFRLDVRGGFWSMPHCHWWRWSSGLRYGASHNGPETPGGLQLNRLSPRNPPPGSGGPEMIHMAFSSSMKSRAAKHAYYRARGEDRERRRKWYCESRSAWESWREGDPLPHGAEVVPYDGPVPECFHEEVGVFTTDKRPEGLKDTLVLRRDFDHKGRQVTEIIYHESDKFDKLIWCLAPFESYEVGGLKNLLVHANYPAGGDDRGARSLVCAEFEKLHGLEG